MNKNITLKKNCILLFALNICVLLSLILFKIYFSKLGYSIILINFMFAVNVVVLIFGIIFNLVLLKNPNKYDEKKSMIWMLVLFIIYLLVNTIVVVIINKPLNDNYKKTADKLALYCDTYICDRYETIREDGIRDFIIYKTYLDYNGVQNDIEIHTKYDFNGVISVKSTIYSQNEMFSEKLIKDQVVAYYNNFNVMIDESLIKEAFDSRFKDSIKKDNLDYKVNEIYEDGELVKLKTIITLNLK